MSKTSTFNFIMASIIAAATTTPVLALRFKDQEQAEAYFARERRAFQNIHENMERSKTDDKAFKLAVDIVFGLHFTDAVENPIQYTQNLIKKFEIPQERQIKILQDMVHERLSVIEKGETMTTAFRIADLLTMLEDIPNYDVLPLLQECVLSKDERVRNDAQRRYNLFMEKAQNQPTPNDNRETASKPEPNIQMIAEPPQPTITDGPTQPIQKTPSELLANSEPDLTAITSETTQPMHEMPPGQPEKTSSNKTLFGLGVIALLAILGGVMVWRKK